MKRFIQAVVLVSPVLLTGCARFIFPSASQIKAWGADTNSWHISLKTIYGNADIDKNMPTAASVPVTLQVQPTR